jgi:8-oxo-dGTP diphosphatase
MPERSFTYDYPHPALTADLIMLTAEAAPQVLLIRRKHEPFAGMWALPGGFVDEGETLEAAARRELREETGLEVRVLEQMQTFGDPDRDPRGWTVSVAFVARVQPNQAEARAGDDAAEVGWHRLDLLPPLAFDHGKVLAFARRWLTAREANNPGASQG